MAAHRSGMVFCNDPAAEVGHIRDLNSARVVDQSVMDSMVWEVLRSGGDLRQKSETCRSGGVVTAEFF